MNYSLLISQLSDHKLDDLSHEQLKNLVRDCRADAQAVERNVAAEQKDCENQLDKLSLCEANKSYLAGYSDALIRVAHGGFSEEIYKKESAE